MKHKTTYLAIIISLILSSCTENKFIEAEPQMVVEGWIDADGYPIVMLSQIIPASENEIKYNNLQDYIITGGKVTISDGEKTIVLTSKKNMNYFPPYIYTSSKIRGEAGKTYYLTAQYKDFYATAEATIPAKAKAEKIFAKEENGIYSINATFNDNPEEDNYYKFFIQVIGRDNSYLSSNFAVVDDKDYTFPCTIPINIGYSSLYNKELQLYKISEQDRIMIKIAQIDKKTYDFWDDYKNIMELGQNPFFRYSNNVGSNISGGLGYWAGYGATEYLLNPYMHDEAIELNK